MKNLLGLILFVLVSLESLAQELPPFRALRYEEDYRFLRADSSRTWYEKLKYTPLSQNGQAYISLGGEVRYQYFRFRNEDWGEQPEDRDGYVLTRYLAHADLRTGRYLRAFVQLQSSLANSREFLPPPVEENQLDLHQAFVEVIPAAGRWGQLTLRLGRQELRYGSQRLVSVRELPNNRQAFDAAKAVLAGKRYSLDAFYSHYVRARKGIFDDRLSGAIRLWGLYGVGKAMPWGGNLDLYYLGLWKKSVVFDDGAGEELRHSAGSRVWGGNAIWQYDLEGVYQFGTVGGKSIGAWTLSSNVSYKLPALRFDPEIGLKAELISGDAIREDNHLQTFNPLFPRGAYFGLAAFIGPANLCDVHPSLALDLVPDKLTLTMDYDAFWRYSRNDGIYNQSATLIYSGEGTTGRFIGHQSALDLTCTPNRHLLLRAESTWFSAGEFLRQASPGKNIWFGGLTVQFKY
jgi:hypothetical protein